MLVPTQQRAFAFDDRGQHPLEQNGLAADEVLAAFDPGEDQQVLDQPLEPLGLGRDVGHELVARRSGSSRSPRPSRIWLPP